MLVRYIDIDTKTTNLFIDDFEIRINLISTDATIDNLLIVSCPKIFV